MHSAALVLSRVFLIVQRFRVTQTIRQGRFVRRAITQRIEKEIEGAVVHGEFKIYHGANVHPNVDGLMTSGLGPSDNSYPTNRAGIPDPEMRSAHRGRICAVMCGMERVYLDDGRI